MSQPPAWIPVSRVSVWQMLTRLKEEGDLTILLTTHYMDEADKLCDRDRHRGSRQAGGPRFADEAQDVDSGQ